MVTERLADLVRAALDRAAADGVIGGDATAMVAFERPKRREHGDWATNIAMVVAAGDGPPRAVAEALVERLPESDLVDRVEIAGPGFLNFHLAPTWLHDVVRRAADRASGFGRSDLGAGRKVNVEFVSANPTGPANVVSGRHAAVGDAIANLLESVGYEITREYYINDAGRQAALFGESLAARYLQALGREAEPPEDGYKGEYLIDLGREIADEVGDRYAEADPAERNRVMGDLGLKAMVESIRASLERFGTRFDTWVSQADLEAHEVAPALDSLRASGWIVERDGAEWLQTTRAGDDKDRVVVRADGRPTYLASDIAYMRHKFERGFDHLVYLLGADHHGTLPRLFATAESLGYGRDRVEFPIVQNVTILRRGEAVRASKRAGVLVLLDELVNEAGVDAARYTFLTRSMDSPLDFDIELAKERAPENPVYYTQYAHARICSILRRAEEQGHRPDVARARLELLAHPAEDRLMRRLAAYEELVIDAARLRAPQKVTRYVEELASDFSGFYRDCRVVSEDGELTAARLALCIAVRAVIADALGLLGVSAPERM
jgi:arginyl-tRNA synthetase